MHAIPDRDTIDRLTARFFAVFATLPDGGVELSQLHASASPAEGWRISAIAWDDEREGLRIPKLEGA